MMVMYDHKGVEQFAADKGLGDVSRMSARKYADAIEGYHRTLRGYNKRACIAANVFVTNAVCDDPSTDEVLMHECYRRCQFMRIISIDSTEDMAMPLYEIKMFRKNLKSCIGDRERR